MRSHVHISCVLALVAMAFPLQPSAQQPLAAAQRAAPAPACDNGLVVLEGNVTGRLTICSSLASQAPALTRQLEAINRAFQGQQQQLTELTRLIRSVNSVGQNMGNERQTELLRNLLSQLQVSQQVGPDQTERLMTMLADGFERLRDQILAGLTNRASSERVRTAFEGPLGDSVAQLNLPEAEKQLSDIRGQLTTIGNQVAEVNRRAADIQTTLDKQQMELPRVSSALASADVRALRALSAGGLPTTMLEEAFRSVGQESQTTIAGRFFENSLTNPAAIEWFDSALAAGLDPNIAVPSAYYGREALLISAMRAGNAAAMKVLLHRKASPHPYQDLAFTRFEQARFIFPLVSIAKDERFTLQEKQDLAREFFDAGGVVPRVLPFVMGQGWGQIVDIVNDFREQIAPSIGLSLPESPLCCSAQSPICQAASERTGEDWCAIVATMPKRFVPVNASSSPVYAFELEYLLNIERNKAYFLASAQMRDWDYVVVEASKDASSWIVYRYMSPMGSMGLCKTEDKYQPDYCWRRIPIQRIAGTDQAHFDTWNVTWRIMPAPSR